MPVRVYRRKELRGGGVAGDLLTKLLLETPQLLGRALAEPVSALGEKVGKWIKGSGYRPPKGGSISANKGAGVRNAQGYGFRLPGEYKKKRIVMNQII